MYVCTSMTDWQQKLSVVITVIFERVTPSLCCDISWSSSFQSSFNTHCGSYNSPCCYHCLPNVFLGKFQNHGSPCAFNSLTDSIENTTAADKIPRCVYHLFRSAVVSCQNVSPVATAHCVVKQMQCWNDVHSQMIEMCCRHMRFNKPFCSLPKWIHDLPLFDFIFILIMNNFTVSKVPSKLCWFPSIRTVSFCHWCFFEFQSSSNCSVFWVS